MDSTPKGINLINFSSLLTGGTYMKAFPWAKPTQVNHYVRPTLDEFKCDTEITHAFYNQRVKIT